MKRILILLALLITWTVEGQVQVKGYYKSNGTYVEPHVRSSPDNNPYNNYSYPGNYNPNTNQTTTGNTDTYLNNYYNQSNTTKSNSDVWVNGYYKSDGTYVEGHWRSAPNGNPYDNFSYPGNINPYTGKVASGNPDTYLKNYYVTSNTLNIRSGPSTDYSVLTTLSKGDNIEVIESYNDNWKKVKITYMDYSSYTYKSEVGYAYSSFISTSDPNYTSYNSSELPTYNNNFTNYYTSSAKSTNYVNTSNLNVRSTPSTEAAILTTLSYGEKVDVVEITNSNWAKVEISYYDANTFEYKTATGYVYRSYLSSNEKSEDSSNDLWKLLSGNSNYNSSEYNYESFNKTHPYGVNMGKMTFWTDCGTDGEIFVYVDDTYIGVITKYFTGSGSPDCSESGTVSITKSAGTYKVLAKGNEYKWEGYIIITADKCTMEQFKK